MLCGVVGIIVGAGVGLTERGDELVARTCTAVPTVIFALGHDKHKVLRDDWKLVVTCAIEFGS